MQLAFSTNAYTRFGLSRALEGIRDAGFAAAEILADVPHAYPGTLNSALIYQIAKEVERTGLKNKQHQRQLQLRLLPRSAARGVL